VSEKEHETFRNTVITGKSKETPDSARYTLMQANQSEPRTSWNERKFDVWNFQTRNILEERLNKDLKTGEASSYPWRETVDPRETKEPPWIGNHLGQYSRYSRMYEIGNREGNRRFSRKRSDYPMFRKQLLRDYNILWESDPYCLLQKVANLVMDTVYEHIKSVWIMRNPQEALDRIWEILKICMENQEACLRMQYTTSNGKEDQ